METIETLESKISVLCDGSYWHWRAADGAFCRTETKTVMKLSDARRTHRECTSCDRIKYEMNKGW